MRKLHKRQISEQLSTLCEACDELQRQSGQAFVDFCAETQEFVSGILRSVETVTGEGTEIAASPE